MLNIYHAVFIIAILGIFYAYVGYPVLLIVIGLLKNNKVIKQSYLPNISIIITAYNEQKRIRSKIENTLQLEYPVEKLQIIVASDGSTDETTGIIREYEGKKVDLIEISERKGKENAQKAALKIAKGEIIIFSDASTFIDKSGLKEIVANFSDPTIGCVSGMDKVITETDIARNGESVYVNYEMLIRILESKVSTVVGLSGSFFAARKEVCNDFSVKMDSDFRTLLNSRKMGLRGIVDPSAVGYYKNVNNIELEFLRKIRTVVRGLTVFFNSIEFCNIFKYHLFSLQYISHKFFKWLVPFFLVAIFISSFALSFKSAFFFDIFIFQIAFYILAALPILIKPADNLILVKIPHFFVSSNLAIIIAWYKFLRGEQFLIWQPSKRH